MSPFHSYTFTWRQVALLKLAVLALGIAIGAYWSAFFSQYLLVLVALGVILGVYLAYVVFEK